LDSPWQSRRKKPTHEPIDFSELEITPADDDALGLNFPSPKMTLKEFKRLLALKDSNREPRDFSNVVFVENIDFREEDLSGVNFLNATLKGAVFDDQTNLMNVDFSGATLTGASFFECNLTSTIFSEVNAENVTFTGSDLTGIDLSNDIILSGATFQSSSRRELTLTGVDFSGAALEGATFDSTGRSPNIIFNNTRFNEATLTGATFTSCDLSGTSFDAANLTQSRFTDCRLYGYEGNNQAIYEAASFNNTALTAAIFRNVQWRSENEETKDEDQNAIFVDIAGGIWINDSLLQAPPPGFERGSLDLVIEENQRIEAAQKRLEQTQKVFLSQVKNGTAGIRPLLGSITPTVEAPAFRANTPPAAVSSSSSSSPSSDVNAPLPIATQLELPARPRGTSVVKSPSNFYGSETKSSQARKEAIAKERKERAKRKKPLFGPWK
jgi:uncharacterized protein YjbI with pentapeptide repeats